MFLGVCKEVFSDYRSKIQKKAFQGAPRLFCITKTTGNAGGSKKLSLCGKPAAAEGSPV